MKKSENMEKNAEYSTEPKNGKYQCACCLNYVFDELGSYDFCPICGWQDESLQNEYMDYGGGANEMSIRQARAAFKAGKPIE